jgi:hypothetical protein
MPDTRELDTRIRDLVARAVADAPRPPELDPTALPEVELDHGHRRWWIGGGAALLAAAAAITTLLLVNGTDQSVRTPPATDPTIVVAPAPPAAPTSTPTSGTLPPAMVEPQGPFLTAGPDGVVDHRGSERRLLTPVPVAIALDTGDGGVIVQRRRGEGSWTAADAEPQLIRDDGSLRPLFDGFDWGGHVMLHDLEVVDGRRLLLYSVFEGDPPRPQTLYVVDVGTAERVEIGPTDVDPAYRLHLATTGLIVGTFQNQLTLGIEIHAVPDSPAAEQGIPTAADFGLDPSYVDCTDCPSAFTVTADGTQVAWIDNENNLVTVSPAGGTPEPVMGVPGALFADADWDGQRLLLSFTPAHGSVPVDLPGGRPLEGRIATMSPFAPGRAAEPPPTTEPTSENTEVAVPVSPPATADGALTAGPDGVVEHVGEEIRTLTTESMVIALDAGADQVIVQRRAGHDGRGEWTDAETAPQVIGDDGSPRPLLDGFDWGGGVVLHDVAVVEGRRLLLYSVQRPQPLPDPENPEQDLSNEDLYVVDLDAQERNLVAAGIGGWELGTGPLHLASTGLIVGENGSGASHGIAILAVPGSPADVAGVPTPADLGLQPSYGDCTDCPHAFSVSSDGQTVAWIDGATDRLTRVPVAGGPPEQVVEVPAERFADLDYAGDGAVLSFFEFVSAGATPAPLLVPFDGSGPVELEGTTATFSPAG